MDRPPTDGCRLLDFVAEAESAALSSWGEARDLTLKGLTKLIACDVVLCCEGPGPRLGWTATDATVVEPRVREMDFWLSCYAQIPCLVHWDRVGEGVAVRSSDHVSQRAYRRTPVHNHFYRPFGLDHVVTIRIALPTGQLIDFGCEAGGRDFTDRDVSLLERLRPYLAAILDRAQTGTLSVQLRSAFALTRREADVLALLARGRSNQAIGAALFVSPGTVRKHRSISTPSSASTHEQQRQAARSTPAGVPPQVSGSSTTSSEATPSRSSSIRIARRQSVIDANCSVSRGASSTCSSSRHEAGRTERSPQASVLLRAPSRITLNTSIRSWR
jgi:hypothetical protein